LRRVFEEKGRKTWIETISQTQQKEKRIANININHKATVGFFEAYWNKDELRKGPAKPSLI